MNELVIKASQTPGMVTFDNFEEVRSGLLAMVQNFEGADYSAEGLDAAVSARDTLKKMRDVITGKQKELQKAYSAPYVAVEQMMNELVEIIDGPYKQAKSFVDDEEKRLKREQVMAYAAQKAETLGEAGKKIIGSPVFFSTKWLNKSVKVKQYQDEINEILERAASDIRSIQTAGGDNTQVLMAHYYETLSMSSVKNMQETLSTEQDAEDMASVPSEKNVLGYKILKITATEDQMAAVLDQLELMGLEVEEIEDGMPKPMQELTVPDFDSFVAFDIETTGSNGAANGDGEAKITEIGAVRVVNGVVTEKFDELANPGRKIVPRIARLTGITDEMVADKPSVDEVIRRFREFVGDSTLVGHNIKSSDLHYITKAADKAGVCFDMPFLDTYLLAKTVKTEMGWEKLNLSYLSAFYSLEHKAVHRAWSDAEVNAQVYFELQKVCR